MAQPQNEIPYGKMSVTKDLRPMLKRAGFKNYNRFNRELIAEICEEYDRVNQVRIRDLPVNRSPSEADEEACNAMIKSWLERRESGSTSTTAAQSSSRTNTKRKQTETAESPKGKRQKVSKGEKNDKVGSDAEDKNGDTGARHVSGKDNVTETNAQASETQTAHKTHEKRKRLLKSKPSSSQSGNSTPTSGTNTITKTSKTTKKSVASKAAQQPVASKKAKQSVASNAKPSQEPTRRSTRNKKPMNIIQPSGEESRDPQTEMSEPAVSRVKDTSALPANPSSATERLGAEDNGAGPEDSSDDSDDSSDDSENDGEEVEDDGEDDSDDSDEEQRPRPTPKSPARRTPHNYHLGTHRTFRYEPQWDPLDERIPTSSLNWFEQVQRQRARQAQLRVEAGAASPSEGGPKPTKK